MYEPFKCQFQLDSTIEDAQEIVFSDIFSAIDRQISSQENRLLTTQVAWVKEVKSPVDDQDVTNFPVRFRGQPEEQKPYDASKAAELIRQLAAADPAQVAESEQNLIAMGHLALPQIAQALTDSNTLLEARVRAGRILVVGERERAFAMVEQYTGVADNLPEKFEQLLERMGFMIWSGDLENIGEPARFSTKHAEYESESSAVAELSDKDRKAFNDMIDVGDKLTADANFETVTQLLTYPRNQITSHDDRRSQYYQAQIAQEYRRQEQRMSVLALSKDARLFYAEILSRSPLAEDKRRGVELLIEQMGRNREAVRQFEFLNIAQRLAAQDNLLFRLAFEKSGGELKHLIRAREQSAPIETPAVLR